MNTLACRVNVRKSPAMPSGDSQVGLWLSVYAHQRAHLARLAPQSSVLATVIAPCAQTGCGQGYYEGPSSGLCSNWQVTFCLLLELAFWQWTALLWCYEHNCESTQSMLLDCWQKWQTHDVHDSGQKKLHLPQ